MDNLEARVYRVEHGQVTDEQKIDDLLRRVAALEQQAVNQAGGGGWPSAPSGTWTLYTCTVPGVVTGPTTFSAAISPVMGPGSSGTFTINLAIPGPTVSGKMGYVLGDGSGHYYLISQSCT